MRKPLYQITDRDLLRSIAAFQGGFQPPKIVLEGLTEEQAFAKTHGLPHSIADIVGHMCYWQEWFNRAAAERFRGISEHAAEGWPRAKAGEWNALRERFLAAAEKTEQLALTSDKLFEKMLPAGVELPFLERESLGSGLLHGAVHSAHHLGQIITIRQLLGLWPPSGGSMTW